MNAEYGIATPSGKVKHKGFTREEAYAYVECEGTGFGDRAQPGEFIIRKHEGVWYATATGHSLEEIRDALKLEN